MGDTTSLAAWTPTFESWRAEALPKIQEGKTKDAFGSYPWFTLGAVGCRLLGAPLPSTPMTPTPIPGPVGAGGR